MADDLLRDVFLGFIKVHILHHAARSPVYGLALIAELQRHGYALSAGTLYPVLHGLEAAGYLTSESRVVGGKVRKYYSSTTRGQTALAELLPKIEELMREVLHGEGPDALEDAAEDDTADA